MSKKNSEFAESETFYRFKFSRATGVSPLLNIGHKRASS